MRMNGNRRLIGILVLATVVLGSVQVVGAAGEVIWYWKNVNASGFNYPSHTFAKFMNTTEPPQTATNNTVTIDEGKSAWWYAHEAAQCDLSFPSATWIATYWVKALNLTDNGKWVYTKLYSVSPDGTDTPIDSRIETISSAGSIEQIIEDDFNASDFNIQEGGRLAVEVYWVGTANGSLEVYYNSSTYSSSLTSPPNSPAWPVPELSTLILFSTGLIALAGYVLLTKRKK